MSTIKKTIGYIYSRKWLLFLSLALIFWVDYYILGPASYYLIKDTGNIVVPRYIALKDVFLNFGSSHWFPYAACGIDRLANNIHFLDLATLFYFVFPDWLAYGLIVILQRFVAGYFTYRVAKDYLKFSETGSVFAGVFANIFLNELLAFRLGLMGFPLLLWLFERLNSSDRRENVLIILGASILYSISANLPNNIPFACLLSFLWFFIVRDQRSLIFYGKLSLFWAVAFLIQWPTIESMLLASPLSQRSEWGSSSHDYAMLYGNYANQYHFFFDRIFLHFFRSPYSVVLVVAGGILTKGRSKLYWKLVGMVLICTLAPFIYQSVKYNYMDQFGFFKGFNMTRVRYFVEFFVAFLGALGLDAFYQWAKEHKPSLKIGKRAIRTFTLALVISYFFSLVFLLQLKKYNVVHWLKEGTQAKNHHSQVLEELAQKNKTERFRVSTIAWGRYPDYAVAYRLEMADGYVPLYPNAYKHFWSKVIEPFTKIPGSEFNSLVFNNWGNTIFLYLADFIRTRDFVDVDELYRMNLLSLANTKYIISKLPVRGQYLKPIVEQKENWLKLSSKDKALINIKSNFLGGDFLNIYENTQVLSRYFLAKELKSFADTKDLFNALGEAKLSTLKESIFVEDSVFEQNRLKEKKYSRYSLVEDYYSPDSIELTVEADGAGYLFVSNSYSPYWQCTVNGEKSEIFPAHGAFWGVKLSEGLNKVRFTYEPSYKKYGILSKF